MVHLCKKATAAKHEWCIFDEKATAANLTRWQDHEEAVVARACTARHSFQAIQPASPERRESRVTVRAQTTTALAALDTAASADSSRLSPESSIMRENRISFVQVLTLFKLDAKAVEAAHAYALRR